MCDLGCCIKYQIYRILSENLLISLCHSCPDPALQFEYDHLNTKQTCMDILLGYQRYNIHKFVHLCCIKCKKNVKTNKAIFFIITLIDTNTSLLFHPRKECHRKLIYYLLTLFLFRRTSTMVCSIA